jgi:hypothetical protein
VKERRRDDAVRTLHHGTIDDKLISPGPLLDEFHSLQRWWRQACDAVIAQRHHHVLKDETEYATEWCLAIAQEIIDAEREIRAGTGGDTEIRQYTRRMTWERFENLEKGLMSNGVARPTSRR